ncbi:NAD(P)H-hydrate dehydratase [bacterium]|nr:NAD(P)H-hydrate dehydratase [bacterium]
MIRVTTLPELPSRPADAHKGVFGRVSVVAGSRGMAGAACLSGVAALRSGAGLVTVASAESIIPVIASYEPSYLTVPLKEDEAGRISGASLAAIVSLLLSSKAGVIGPGLGRSPQLNDVVINVYRRTPVPMVVDADGLNVLANSGQDITRSSLAGYRVLTPHPGEFARLTGKTTVEIAADRENLAWQFAKTHGVVLVLKGAGTVVTDGERLAINTTGNAGMATGGTGDVLSGVIAALMAQGLDPFAAAQLGVHVHGLAGDLAATEHSQMGMIASDVVRSLGRAWKTFGAA